MNILDNKRIHQIIGSFKEVNKAYTEGIYADTPANRKLGRVGMSYEEYAKKGKSDNVEELNWEDHPKLKELKDTKAELRRGYYELDNSFLKSIIDVNGIDSFLGYKYGRRFYLPRIDSINGKDPNIKYSEDEIFKFKTKEIAEKWIKEKVKKYLEETEFTINKKDI